MWKVFLAVTCCALLSGANSLKFGKVYEACDPDNPDTHLVNDFACCACFIACHIGQQLPQRCPHGYYFDSYSKTCAWSTEVVCEPCPEQGIIYVPVDGSCTDYLVCVNGQSIERTCAPGTRFDRVALQCVLAELADCEIYVNCPTDATEPVIIADPNSCQHYVICMNGLQKERRQCATGLIFDSNRLKCVREEDFDCQLWS